MILCSPLVSRLSGESEIQRNVLKHSEWKLKESLVPLPSPTQISPPPPFVLLWREVQGIPQNNQSSDTGRKTMANQLRRLSHARTPRKPIRGKCQVFHHTGTMGQRGEVTFIVSKDIRVNAICFSHKHMLIEYQLYARYSPRHLGSKNSGTWVSLWASESKKESSKTLWRKWSMALGPGFYLWERTGLDNRFSWPFSKFAPKPPEHVGQRSTWTPESEEQ